MLCTWYAFHAIMETSRNLSKGMGWELRTIVAHDWVKLRVSRVSSTEWRKIIHGSRPTPLPISTTTALVRKYKCTITAAVAIRLKAILKVNGVMVRTRRYSSWAMPFLRLLISVYIFSLPNESFDWSYILHLLGVPLDIPDPPIYPSFFTKVWWSGCDAFMLADGTYLRQYPAMESLLEGRVSFQMPPHVWSWVTKTNWIYSSSQILPSLRPGNWMSIPMDHSVSLSHHFDHKLLLILGGKRFSVRKNITFKSFLSLPSPGVPPRISVCESLCERGMYEGPSSINHKIKRISFC